MNDIFKQRFFLFKKNLFDIQSKSFLRKLFINLHPFTKLFHAKCSNTKKDKLIELYSEILVEYHEECN